MRIIKGGAGDRPQSCRGEAGGLREYWDGGGGVDLLVEGQGGNRPGVFLDDENYCCATARAGERSKAATQLRCAGVRGVGDCGGIEGVFSMDRRMRAMKQTLRPYEFQPRNEEGRGDWPRPSFL